jgi:uncharacterized membrane protein YkvA (DUF1232 family)
MEAGIRTIQDLRKYLQERDISPEQLAVESKISNMTIRRLLKKPRSSRIPERYHAQFDRAVQGALAAKLASSAPAFGASEFGALLADLENQGREVRDLNRLQENVDTKLKDPGIGSILKDQVLTLLRAIRSDRVSGRTKAVAIGALLYLINPFDLIPDALPGVGYLDDLAVLSLGASLIAGTIVLTEDKGKTQASEAV